LDMSLTRKQGGTGLGLSISRGIILAHGGTIEATSAGQGQGTTFTFRLPRSEDSQSARHTRDDQ
jgi:signal transduction histidine kinase